METQPHSGVLVLMERLLARARAARETAGPAVPRLMPGLAHRLRKTEELMRARGEKDAWLPEAKEAKMSPMEYMDRCNRFLCKLDTLGWRRSFHQNLFHAVRVRCCRAAPPRPPRPRARPARPASDKHSRAHRTSSAPPRAPFSNWKSRAHSRACTECCCRRTTGTALHRRSSSAPRAASARLSVRSPPAPAWLFCLSR